LSNVGGPGWMAPLLTCRNIMLAAGRTSLFSPAAAWYLHSQRSPTTPVFAPRPHMATAQTSPHHGASPAGVREKLHCRVLLTLWAIFTAVPSSGQNISAPLPSGIRWFRVRHEPLSLSIYVPHRCSACTVAGLACSRPIAPRHARPSENSCSPRTSTAFSLAPRAELSLTRLSIQVEHDAYGHDEKHASDLVSISRSILVICVGEVVGVEHGSRQDLIPVISEQLFVHTHIQLTCSQ